MTHSEGVTITSTLLQEARRHAFVGDADLLLTDHLLRNSPQPTEGAALLLCHLSLAVQAGHLCVRRCGTLLEPSVDELWRPRDEEAARWLCRRRHAIESMLAEAWDDLPAAAAAAAGRRLCELVRDGPALYWQRWWRAEGRLAAALAERLKHSPVPPFPEEALHRCVEELLREGRLTAEQARAVEAAAGNLTLISGGPGTGKTHTAAQLVQALASHLQRGGDDPLRVAVAAPTGKAAAHLSKSIERRGLTVGVALHSATLHSLLIAAEGDEASSLPYDVVLVDECSMVDVALMERLLGRTPFACRLVMMGDHNQLPSVEPGAPFQELIAFMQTAEARRRPVLLTRSLRTDSGQILACADAIKGGEAPLAARLCGEGDAVAWPRRALPDDPRPLIGEVADRFPAPHLDNYRALLHAFRLLTPHRQGSWGSEALNRHILKRLVARHGARPFAAPFIITANDHQLRLYNGEMGVLMMHNPLHGIGEGDYALFDGDGGQRRLDAALLPPHELAYCLTVHKSQGSEYDEVLIVMPPGSELFGREALYTAVTRAKRRVTLWCSPDTFCKTVEASHRRVGFLEERLRRLVDGADSKSYS